MFFVTYFYANKRKKKLRSQKMRLPLWRTKTLTRRNMQKLTKAEEEIMQLVWDLGRGTVSDLLERMEEPRPPHSTVSSVVRILEKKGYVDHKAYGKTHEYFPIVAKEDYGRRSLTDVLRNYFDGSVSRLVSHLVEDKKLSADEVLEIMKKLDEKS